MNLFNDIYDLTYLHLLTPTNLLESLNIDNFVEINYSKNEIGVIAKVVCFVDKHKMSFYYQFDFKNFINEIYYYEDDKLEYLFNREEKLKNLRSEFSKSKVL